MKYKLDMDEDVVKWLKTLQSKQYKQLAQKIFSLMSNPIPQDSLKLDGGKYRVDSGEFRIGYTVDHEKLLVTVFLIGKRNDDEFYRLLKRK